MGSDMGNGKWTLGASKGGGTDPSLDKERY